MKGRTITIICCLAIVVGSGLWWLGAYRQRASDARKLRFAQRLVLTGRGEEALSVINNRRRWPSGSLQHRQWMEVCVDVFEQMGNAIQLGQVFYECPEAFDDREGASLLAARALILRNDISSFERLRSVWRGKEESPHAWMVLEADSLLRQGRRAQALALLTENQLNDQWESARHVRLALLHSAEPAEAWRHLTDALQTTGSLDGAVGNGDESPNAVVRLFRAQLLEASGRIDEAQLEYVASRLAQPDNAAFCDQLAEFYRRRSAYPQMLATWQGAEGDARSDFIDLKQEFWSRVTLPLADARTVNANGHLEGLVQLIQSLPDDQFWNEELVPEYQCSQTAERRPEARWLRRLEWLRTGNETAAIESLHDSPTVPWESPIRRTLLMTLNLRQFGELDPKNELRTDLPVARRDHPMIDQLKSLHANDQEPPADLRRLLQSDHGLAMVMLAHGWLNAATKLSPLTALPDDAPDWAAYGMTQALRHVKGAAVARRFAKHQPKTDELTLLVAELTLKEDANEALQQLQTLSQVDGAVGERANWLAVVSLIQQQRLDNALEWLHARHDFHQSRRGQELRARIALLQFDVDTATKIYQQLQGSVEAKVFLARSAVHDKNWEEARRLTLELLDEFPADQDLLHSLQFIEQSVPSNRAG